MRNSSTLRTVEQLDLRSNQVNNLMEFCSLKCLSWLSLSSNALCDVVGLPHLPELKYLGLFANFLGTRPLSETAAEIKNNCPVVTHVFLLGNQYTDTEINEVLPRFSIISSPYPSV
jgi:hypothetical protein